MTSSVPSSPDDNGQKFYDELLNKYQLFRTKNNLNIEALNNESNNEPNNDLNNELNNESNDELDFEISSNDLNSSINELKNKVSNVFIVEPNDRLLTDWFDDEDLTLCEKLQNLKKCLKNEIDKENKIKEGTENLREVSKKDQNTLQHLNCILKQSNYRLNELKRDLNELNSYLKINSGQDESPKPQKKDSFDSYSDKEEEIKNLKFSQLDVSKIRSDNISIASSDCSLSSPNSRILALEKQLDIENKVKEGAENMLEMYSKSKNKKFMKEAKAMLEYSQAKIDYIRMMIDKIKENDKRLVKKADEKSAANLNLLQFESLVNPNMKPKLENNYVAVDKNDQDDKFKNRFLQYQSKSSSCLPNNSTDFVLDEELINLINQEKSLNLRIEELKARLKLELTLMDGLKNIILTLQADKVDKNTIQDAKTKLIESYQKVYLLRSALKSIIDKLDSKSTKFKTINEILKLSKNVTTDLKEKSIYTSLPTDFNEHEVDLNEIGKQSQFSLLKTSAVCGKLEIRLIGIKNLLTKIERYDSETSKSSLKSSKNYKVNSKTKSNEIKAVLKLDNIKVAETTWQNIKTTDQDEYSNCFNCLGFFPIELDRNRELEIQFHYNDFREFCAFKYLYLEDFVDSQTSNYELDLEPQGSVKFDLRILNAMMISKNNRLQRRKLLRFKGETFLRPNQLKNVAAWSRLMKNNVFGPPNKFSSTKSFASFTSTSSSKKLSERSSSTESSSSSTSLSQIKLERQATSDSFMEEDENELESDDDSISDNIRNTKINDDKLLFIKQLKEQKDQSNEIEIASLSSGEEEEIELIDMSVTEVDEPLKKGVFRSKTENLRAKPTMRKTKEELKIDLNPIKQTIKIESVEDSDEDSDLLNSNIEQTNKINTDNKQPNIIEIDDDLLISNYQEKEHPLSKLNLTKYEEKKDQIDLRPETKWETKELKLNEFSFVCTLGRGYFGKVLLSKHNPTNSYYAIKVLKKKDVLARYEVDTLLNEKQVFLLANQYKHPFLIQLFACIQTKDHCCFVMESVMGGDLMHHINQEIFDEDRVIFYASSIVLCIEFLHKNKIIYRDLKLDNILLDKLGYIKLTDYGLCKELAHGQTTNTFCGTPDQIAPELLTSDSYTNAVDWWALGIVIYQMSTGHSPFLGDDTEEIFDSIVNDEVIFPKYLSFESTVLIRRLLRKDPAKRLGSSPRDAEDIKKHSFFKEINFDDLYHKRIKAPFEPTLKCTEDVSNFEYEFTCRDPSLSFSNVNRKLSDKDQKLFGSFDFISNEWKEIMDQNQNNQKNKEDEKNLIYNNREQTNLKEANQNKNDEREIQQLSDKLNIETVNQLDKDLKQSTGEKDDSERQTDTIPKLKTEGEDQNEEIFVDLIERQDE